jgi:hypothetical protein
MHNLEELERFTSIIVAVPKALKIATLVPLFGQRHRGATYSQQQKKQKQRAK